jgi:hypothetical protein
LRHFFTMMALMEFDIRVWTNEYPTGKAVGALWYYLMKWKGDVIGVYAGRFILVFVLMIT